jgi:hypothetical protein
MEQGIGHSYWLCPARQRKLLTRMAGGKSSIA